MINENQNIKINELLPIGSVVLLKDGKKRLMICGVKQADSNDLSKEYDYIGVLYPEGHMGSGFQYLFNHNKIEKIFFKGYEDKERIDFLSKLETIYKKKENT